MFSLLELCIFTFLDGEGIRVPYEFEQIFVMGGDLSQQQQFLKNNSDNSFFDPGVTECEESESDDDTESVVKAVLHFLYLKMSYEFFILIFRGSWLMRN